MLQDLLAWRDARVARAEPGYWRTTIGEEVDFVIEAANCAHLRTFRAECSSVEWLIPDVLAAPWWRVL